VVGFALADWKKVAGAVSETQSRVEHMANAFDTMMTMIWYERWQVP
jgi:hypothetical protein